VGALEKLSGDTFDLQSLVAAGTVKKPGAGLKVLGAGELSRKITVRAHQFSESAAAKIKAAGGVAEVIETGKK
jgi:large subunit ribosomal protein L15